MLSGYSRNFGLNSAPGHLLGQVAMDVSRMTGIPYAIERISSLRENLPHIDLTALKKYDRWLVLWALIGGYSVADQSVIDDSFEIKARILQEKKYARVSPAGNLATTDRFGGF